VGTGQETSVVELHRIMAEAAGVRVAPAFAPARSGELARSCLDPGRAAIHLGWKPWTRLPVGTGAVLDYFRSADTPA
jgi:UDP-glucose 4-epimerase